MCIAILKLIELNRRKAEAIEQQTKTRRLRNEKISRLWFLEQTKRRTCQPRKWPQLNWTSEMARNPCEFPEVPMIFRGKSARLDSYKRRPHTLKLMSWFYNVSSADYNYVKKVVKQRLCEHQLRKIYGCELLEEKKFYRLRDVINFWAGWRWLESAAIIEREHFHLWLHFTEMLHR